MKQLMTKQFAKWAKKQKIPNGALGTTLNELVQGNYDANLGGHLYKKRIRFPGQGKSSSGRTIIVYKKGDRAIFIHGFAKNEKANLSRKELLLFKEFAKILLRFSGKSLQVAIENSDLLEVKS